MRTAQIMTKDKVKELAGKLINRFSARDMPSFQALEKVLLEELCPEVYTVKLDEDDDDLRLDSLEVTLTDDDVKVVLKDGMTGVTFVWNRKTGDRVYNTKKPKSPEPRVHATSIRGES